MPKYFTKEDKAAILKRLEENKGNLGLTSREMGVALNTLRKWTRPAPTDLTQTVITRLQKELEKAFRTVMKELAPKLEQATAKELVSISAVLVKLIKDTTDVSPSTSLPADKALLIEEFKDRLKKRKQELASKSNDNAEEKAG